MWISTTDFFWLIMLLLRDAVVDRRVFSFSVWFLCCFSFMYLTQAVVLNRLSWMGFADLKGGQRNHRGCCVYQKELKQVWVFFVCNTESNMPDPVLSWFSQFLFGVRVYDNHVNRDCKVLFSGMHKAWKSPQNYPSELHMWTQKTKVSPLIFPTSPLVWFQSKVRVSSCQGAAGILQENSLYGLQWSCLFHQCSV